MVKKLASFIIALSFIMALVPAYAQMSEWSVVSGEATLTQALNGISIEYSAGTPVLKYQSETSFSDIVSVEFECLLNSARINKLAAYSEDGTNSFYVKSTKNIWAINGKKQDGSWNEVSLGYDISEYSVAKYRYIINNAQNTYSLYVDGYELISDYKFLNEDKSVKSLQFTFGVPFEGKNAKAVISNMSVRNITEEELEKEEFGEAIEEKPATAEKVEIYVSPNGDDENAGTIEKPFKTLAAAKEYVKKIKTESGLPADGIDVYLRGGEYRETLRLDMSDSGSENSPVRYIAYEGEKVKITGGEKVDSSLFSLVTDNAVLERLPDKAKGNVYLLKLEEAGLKDKIEIAAMGQSGQKNTGSSVITVNGKNLTAARWPNDGYMNIKSVAENGDVIVDYDNIANWQDLSYAWMYGWANGWYDGSVKVSFDGESGGFKKKSDLSNGGIGTGDKIYFVNILEELDRAGEWYLNPEAGMLYVWLPDKPENCDVEISTEKDSLLRISGTKYIEFTNIDFGACRGDAVFAKKSAGIKFAGCEFKNIGRNAIALEACEKCVIQSCDINNIGRGGITLSGGDKETLTKAENYVINCHISDFSKESKTYSPAVNISGVGSYVLNNRINGAEHTAIKFGGNLNVIDKNEIYAVLTESSDAGAIYGGRSFVDRGNVISNNFIHSVEHSSQKSRMGIYLDDHMCGTTVEGNIIYDYNVAMLLHGGRDNIVKNNVSVNNDKGITAIDWYYKNNLDDETYSMWQELDSSPYQTELWQKTFSNLINIREDEPKEPKYNVVSENLSVSCGIGDNAVTNYQNYSTVENNVNTNDTTVIESIENFNFNINENSDVFKENIFLKSNSYDDIGIFVDEYRNALPQLGDFNLSFPENNAKGIEADNLMLSWEKAENASEYIFTLAKDKDFIEILTQQKVYGKNYITVEGLMDNGTEYYWKVSALMNTSQNQEEKESDIFSFRTEMRSGLICSDDFDNGILPDEYAVGGDVNDKISIADGKLIYERDTASTAASTGLYRDVDIDLSAVESGKLIIEYDVYPEKLQADAYCYNFPLVADSSGNKYVDNYINKSTKDFNSIGQESVEHWHSFTPWNDEEAEDFIYKMKLVLDTVNNKQSLYTAEVPVGYEGKAEYKGYNNLSFSSEQTDGTIKRIYLAKPDAYNSVKLCFDNFRVYEYKPLEISSITNPDGAVLLSDTPKIDITFNSWINEETLSDIKFINAENEISFDCVKNSDTSISLYFREPIEWGESYSLVIPESVKNIYHQGLDEAAVYNYTVRDNPANAENIIISDDFNDGNLDGYIYDGDSSEDLKVETGMIKYKKSNTYGVVTSGLKKEVNIDMNKLPRKRLVIEYDLYNYELRNDAGWLFGFPEVLDENGAAYCSFYFEAGNKLVKRFTTSTSKKVGEMLQGQDVMYHVLLDMDFGSGKYSARFNRFNTITGVLEDTINISEDVFLENVSGKISAISIIRGHKWGKFNIGIDNFVIYYPDIDNIIYSILDENSQELETVSGNTECNLSGTVVNSDLSEFVTILAEYDIDERLVNAFIIDSGSYNEGVVNKSFTTHKDAAKIKIFTWKNQMQMTPVSKLYEW